MKTFFKYFFISKRDYFIAKAMQGFCRNIRIGNRQDMERAAKMSIEYVDIMMKELKW